MSVKLGKPVIPPPAELTQQLEDSILGDTPLSFEDPTSSLVESASYDPGQMILLVTLKAGKVSKRYRYGAVPPSAWVDFYQAESKGRFFTQHIRPLFAGGLENQ